MIDGIIVEGTVGLQLKNCVSCSGNYMVETKNSNGRWVLVDETLENYCPKCKKIFERKFKIDNLKKRL